VIWPHRARRPASAQPGEPVAAGGSPDRGLAAALPEDAPGGRSTAVAAVVVALSVGIDMANAGRVGQQLGSAIAPGVRTVIADMTATRFCDSSGISMLVQAHRQATANGAELRLVVASTAVLRTLTLVRLGDLLPIYPSLSQALAARPAPRPERPEVITNRQRCTGYSGQYAPGTG
jgi:anti-sigma B factor antagonist